MFVMGWMGPCSPPCGHLLFFSGWVRERRAAGPGEVQVLPQGADGCVWKPSALAHGSKRGNWDALARVFTLGACTWMAGEMECKGVHLWGPSFPRCRLPEAESDEKMLKIAQVAPKSSVAGWVMQDCPKQLPKIIGWDGAGNWSHIPRLHHTNRCLVLPPVVRMVAVSEDAWGFPCTFSTNVGAAAGDLVWSAMRVMLWLISEVLHKRWIIFSEQI